MILCKIFVEGVELFVDILQEFVDGLFPEVVIVGA